MALRYSLLYANPGSLGAAGVITHGLGVTPDEYAIVPVGSPSTTAIPCFQAASAPDSTNLYVTMGAGIRFSLFASVNHSIIK